MLRYKFKKRKLELLFLLLGWWVCCRFHPMCNHHLILGATLNASARMSFRETIRESQLARVVFQLVEITPFENSYPNLVTKYKPVSAGNAPYPEMFVSCCCCCLISTAIKWEKRGDRKIQRIDLRTVARIPEVCEFETTISVDRRDPVCGIFSRKHLLHLNAILAPISLG